MTSIFSRKAFEDRRALGVWDLSDLHTTTKCCFGELPTLRAPTRATGRHRNATGSLRRAQLMEASVRQRR
jgi:hypothetical protein